MLVGITGTAFSITQVFSLPVEEKPGYTEHHSCLLYLNQSKPLQMLCLFFINCLALTSHLCYL